VNAEADYLRRTESTTTGRVDPVEAGRVTLTYHLLRCGHWPDADQLESCRLLETPSGMAVGAIVRLGSAG
jgi:hypothetical protein